MGMITDATPATTGFALKLRRERACMSRTMLAARAGVDRRDVTRIENGVGTVGWEKVHRVMVVLGVELPHARVVDT